MVGEHTRVEALDLGAQRVRVVRPTETAVEEAQIYARSQGWEVRRIVSWLRRRMNNELNHLKILRVSIWSITTPIFESKYS